MAEVDRIDPELIQRTANILPSGKSTKAEEIANLAISLLSPTFDSLGSQIFFDGNRSLLSPGGTVALN